MFDDLQKQQNNQPQENKPAQPVQDALQQPVAPKEDVSQKIERLREKGVKQGGRKKLYSIIGIALILLFVGGVAGAGYFYWDEITNFLSSKDEEVVACPMDAKVCPDGSSVGRVPPDCEFAECPVVAEKSTDGKVNIIGNYFYEITSMCSQNCDSFYIGSYELVNELKDIDGINKQEIVWATGNMVKIMELPTIAGPDSRGQIFNKKVEAIKMKIDNYQKINFPKILISEKELSNYLENKEAKFTFEFENPLNQELKFKVRIDDIGIKYNDFQYFTLEPNETKSVQYIYQENFNLKYTRKEDDSFDLVIINDFVDEESFKKYYWDEANNLSSSGTIIYVEKFIELEDCKEEIDISDWQIYRNEEKRIDTDNDGLFDDEEAEYGTDINNSDSDGDGYLDGDEVDAGYNPMGEGRL